MKPLELVQDSAYRALNGERLPDERIPQAMFRIIAEEIGSENFSTEHVATLRDSLTDDGLSEIDKSRRVAEAMRGLRGQAYGLYGSFSERDIAGIEHEGEELTHRVINGVVAYVEKFPDAPEPQENQDFVDACRVAFKPGENGEDKLRSAYVATEIMTPYLAKRLSEIDWKSVDSVFEGTKRLAEELKLFGAFYGAIAPVIEKGFDGHEDTHKDLAEGLFKIGPLFAKMGQVLANGSKAAKNEAQAHFLANVGRAMQEGIAQPTQIDLDKIQKELPKGIKVENVISSASIAHVLKVVNNDGVEMAVKVRRSNIEKSIADNVHSYQLIVDATEAFVQYHAGEGAFDSSMQTILRAMPFGLKLLEDDVNKELSTIAEADAQIKAVSAFANTPEVVIPEVYKDISDSRHLFMDIEPATRISDLPANPVLLKNLLVFGLQSWEKKIWHADLHPGNIKGREDGTVVVYDWAKPIDLKPKFIRNVFNLMSGFVLRSPKRVTRSYELVQSSDYDQVSKEVIASTAKEIFASNKSWNIKKSKTFHTFVMQMGIKHQSALNFEYLSFIRSVGAFSSGAVMTELRKPEYGGKIGRLVAFSKALFSARKIVKRNNKNLDANM